MSIKICMYVNTYIERTFEEGDFWKFTSHNTVAIFTKGSDILFEIPENHVMCVEKVEKKIKNHQNYQEEIK